MNEPRGQGAVVYERQWLAGRIAEVRNRLGDQLAEQLPIDRGDVGDLIGLLDASESLEALP